MSLLSVMKLFGIRQEGFDVSDGLPHLFEAQPLLQMIILPPCYLTGRLERSEHLKSFISYRAHSAPWLLI